MEKLKYLVIHCTATPAGREVTSEEIRRWHTSPPPVGRGWKQVGYSDIIHLDGWIECLVPFDQDNLVDPEEITNGAAGYNHLSHHVVYVGGCDKQQNALDTRTPEQQDALLGYIRYFVHRYPSIIVCGHRDLDPKKACPSFDVSAFCRAHNIPEINILK